MIDSILLFLDKDFSNDGYYIKEFSDNIFFGKDKDNNCVCVRKNNSKEKSFSMKTSSITLYQNYNFAFNTEDGIINGKYDMLVLNKTLVNTRRTFINLCLNFYSSDDERSIIELTQDLIELYKSIKSGDASAEQGLWAELFTIYYLYNNYGIDISKKWHNDNFNKYDFSIDENNKLEVKSTIKETREHSFSHEQIYTEYNVVISSVMMRKDDSGVTIYDLYEKLEDKFNSSYELLSKIQKEMTKYNPDSLIKFDWSYSIDNIRFYLNKTSPKFETLEPEGVHNTSYTVIFEQVPNLTKEELAKYVYE